MRLIPITLTLMLFAVSSMAVEMPDLAKKHGCTTCHATDHMVIGPAWQDVALKYKHQTTFVYSEESYPLEDGLVRKVSFDGKGNWGASLMPPNDPDELQQDEIRQLVRSILKLTDMP